ncbi:GNAT family N-acetyltransferase [Herbiconiux sp. CPCC 205763]|uniref:GNAT family N-acetyltransferase n=1 Tax=Herbiconiux aconitum TaxID=2970913 RepID=A0ABT2GU78_9MICO|nr:GNAT family protein [Herbiconiux aconitum]MCS5719738.1 GNAT family N-acetyltransferase [Herbiconiux aconitum]
MARVRLVPATTLHLAAFLRDPHELSTQLGCAIPVGWPEFPEAIPHTLAVLESRPEEAGWWMHFFLDAESGVLVGSGGFAGPPVDGQVEIGYEIAPEHRRQGYATAAVLALIDRAISSGEVDRMLAHTLATDVRSPGVLRASGFTATGRRADPDDGELTVWQRSVGG